jgi:hypothetical protein
MKHPPTCLADLSFRATDNMSLAKALIAATQSTLRRLDVGEVYTTAGDAVLEIVEPVLGQLTTFTILDGERPYVWRVPLQHQSARASGAYLESALKQLTSVRALTIGFDFANLFNLLTEIPTLRYFSLQMGSYSGRTRLKLLSSQKMVDYLKSSLPSLRSFSLPPSLAWDVWSFDACSRVATAAESAGVELPLS